MPDPAHIVESYLRAYAAGDVDATVAALTDDFTFRGPMTETHGAAAFRDVVAHVAPVAAGHRVLRRWVDGTDVSTLYELDVELPTGREAVLVAEWNTVRGDRVATSHMVFDTGRFQRAPGPDDAIDPVCGMSVDPADAPARRRHDGRDHVFCSVACAERFDEDPDRYVAART